MSTPDADPRRLRLVLVAMCLALGTVVSAVSSLNVALPDLARAVGATPSQLQWIVDAYAVVFAGLLLLAGAAGDRLGRRHVLIAGLAVFSAAAALALLVESAGALIATRAVMGLGAAAIMPSTLSIITSTFPPGERERAVSVWAGVAGGSALLGLLVSGLLLEAFAWDSIFAFTAILGVAALAAALAVAPNSKLDRAGLDALGGILSALALSSLVFAIIEGPERGWADGLTVAAFLFALVLGAAFLAWELRRAEPLLDPRLFALRGFGAGTASIAVQFFAFFGFVFVVLQYLQLVLGYSPPEAGLALAPMALVLIGISSRVPLLLGRFGPRRVAPIGLVLMAAGFYVLSTAGADTTYWLVLLGVLLLGLGMALATIPATAAIVSSLPAAKQGVASAVNDAAREVGGALGIAVLGSALASHFKVSDPGAAASLRLPPPAQAAFVDGMAEAMLIAAAATALAALFVFWRAPDEVPAADDPRPQKEAA